MSRYDALLEPLQIRHLTIRNRVMSTGHVPGYASGGLPTERYYRYHEEKAKGGIGLTVFGGTSAVSPEHTAALWNQLSVADDKIIPYLAEFAERVHRHGAAVMIQLDHLGRRMGWNTEHWFPAIAPSPIPEPGHRSFPKEMDKHDIDRVVGDFAAAAWRAKEAGLDGTELSAAGPHIFAQFWSPYSNRRTDRYGGNLDNRMRFAREVLDAVRKRVGPEFIVGMRVPADEYIEGGLAPEDCIEIARRLEATGMLDFLNVYGGQSYDHYSFSLTNMNMSFPVAPYLHLAAAIRQEVRLPIFHAQRIQDVDTAARAVAEGAVDMVAMTRAHMADPHIIKKLLEGRPEDIRPCVGAAYCIDRLTLGGDALCLHNPATGREETMPHVVAKSNERRRVVIVGAGPAGMEAARVSAERGHDVVLFEAADRVGGQLVLANKPAWRESMSGIARWLESQIVKLGVDLRLSTEADVTTVVAEAPDIVVIATGGVPFKGDFPGSELAVTSWEILGGRVEPGASVLVYDDKGDHQAPSCAEFLAEHGSKVELAYPDRRAFVDIGSSNAPAHLRFLYQSGVVMTPDVRLEEIYNEGNRLVAVLKNEYTRQEEERVVDQIVSEQGTRVVDVLFKALCPLSVNEGELDIRALLESRPQGIRRNPRGRFQLFRVGDCVASRNIHAAIYDSLRLCKDF